MPDSGLPISHKIARRLGVATEQAREFSHTYRRMTPLLGQSVTTFELLVQQLEELAQRGRSILDELQVVYGYAQEGTIIAEEHADQIVQVATIMQNLDVFLEGDSGMLEHVMRTADVPILKEALGKLESNHLVLLQQAINEAIDEYEEKQE